MPMQDREGVTGTGATVACRSLRAAELLPGNEMAHPIWVTRDYPPASLTYAMASYRTTARALSATAGTHIFAGLLRHADHLVRRLIAFPWRLGELDSTLITVMLGNGAAGRVATKRKQRCGHDGDSQEVWHAGICPRHGAGRGG